MWSSRVMNNIDPPVDMIDHFLKGADFVEISNIGSGTDYHPDAPGGSIDVQIVQGRIPQPFAQTHFIQYLLNPFIPLFVVGYFCFEGPDFAFLIPFECFTTRHIGEFRIKTQMLFQTRRTWFPFLDFLLLFLFRRTVADSVKGYSQWGHSAQIQIRFLR